MRLAEVEFSRPLTHDLARSFIEALGGRMTRATVNRHTDNMFFAEIELVRDGKTLVVDARPSDSIAMALRTGAELYADEALLKARDESAESSEDAPERPQD